MFLTLKNLYNFDCNFHQNLKSVHFISLYQLYTINFQGIVLSVVKRKIPHIHVHGKTIVGWDNF